MGRGSEQNRPAVSGGPHSNTKTDCLWMPSFVGMAWLLGVLGALSISLGGLESTGVTPSTKPSACVRASRRPRSSPGPAVSCVRQALAIAAPSARRLSGPRACQYLAQGCAQALHAFHDRRLVEQGVAHDQARAALLARQCAVGVVQRTDGVDAHAQIAGGLDQGCSDSRLRACARTRLSSWPGPG